MALPLQILKSSRPSKITGDFGEALVLYWLSKHGFECAPVNHTGLALIARNPHTKEVMGISVKGRCRNLGQESEFMCVPKDNFEKAKFACEAFGCIPYFAIVIDAKDSIKFFIMQMSHLLELFPIGRAIWAWKMTAKHLKKYYSNAEIKIFEFQTTTKNGWR